MSDTDSKVIRSIGLHPRFSELVRRRSRLSSTLMIMVLSTYSLLIALVCFYPKLLGNTVSENSPITYAVLLSVFVVVFGACMTALYVRRANTELDELSDRVVWEAQK